jgi:hypothetical protein
MDSRKPRTSGSKKGLPTPLMKLKQIVSFGLEQTASLFAPITVAYGWIHQAASILDNEAGLDATAVKQSFQSLLAQMSCCQEQAGTLKSGIVHFLKITRSYRLMHPSTNRQTYEAIAEKITVFLGLQDQVVVS